MALGKAIEKQQAEIARMERFIERFRYKATKARQAQSRLKKLDKMERIERDPRDGRALGFDFKPPERSGRVIFELEDGRLEVAAAACPARRRRALARARRARLARRAQRHGQDDAHRGAGRPPRARRRQACAAATTSSVGYLSQHGEELEHGRRAHGARGGASAPGLTPNQARALLGRFLFSGEEAEKPLDGLSGGERKRLALAILVQSGANVLILDEPTNHLDLESREALEDALRAFQGALLLVTHDRALLDAVGSRTVAIEDQRAALLRRRLARVRAACARSARRAASRRRGRPRARDGARAGRGRSEPRRRPARRGAAPASAAGKAPVEEPPARAGRASSGPSRTAEAALAALEDELADPERWATKYESAKSTPATRRPSARSRTPTRRSRLRGRGAGVARFEDPPYRHQTRAVRRLRAGPTTKEVTDGSRRPGRQGRRRRLAVVAALLALAAAIPAAGALASGSGGGASEAARRRRPRGSRTSSEGRPGPAPRPRPPRLPASPGRLAGRFVGRLVRHVHGHGLARLTGPTRRRAGRPPGVRAAPTARSATLRGRCPRARARRARRRRRPPRATRRCPSSG